MTTTDDAELAAADRRDEETLEITCFLHEGWKPLIRPASPKRDWMDATPESFAYRCLPLNIANARSSASAVASAAIARSSACGMVMLLSLIHI